jgi:hypothetical protein
MDPKDVILNFYADWNRKDGQALLSYFTDDSEIIEPGVWTCTVKRAPRHIISPTKTRSPTTNSPFRISSPKAITLPWKQLSVAPKPARIRFRMASKYHPRADRSPYRMQPSSSSQTVKSSPCTFRALFRSPRLCGMLLI